MPGPRMDDDVWEDVANGYSKCRRYCGCRGDWDELAPYPGDLESSNSTSTRAMEYFLNIFNHDQLSNITDAGRRKQKNFAPNLRNWRERKGHWMAKMSPCIG